MSISVPKGTKDLLPVDSYKWQYVEGVFRKVAATYGCREIRTPMFEYTELFHRGVGETTDIVQKEMYTFEDKGGRSITLKPEGTAPAARAFIENSLYAEAQPTKMYYFTPAFRYENVQKGRLRQHHQFGVEVYGSKEASADAEVISIIWRVYKELGLTGVSLNINNIGCPQCRKKYNNALKEYLTQRHEELCGICKTRYETNTLRILDCKNNHCQEIINEAPSILDFVCDECKVHFQQLKTYLEAIGINYVVNPILVRGLDYYTKTVFEFIDEKGSTLCGGGRYDNLIEEIGGPPMGAVGFGMGIERLLLALGEKSIDIPKEAYMDLYIGSIGDSGNMYALKLANELREKGLKCDLNHMGRSVKAQMKFANKNEAKYTLILGDNELQQKKAMLKRMSDGEQKEINIEDLDRICSIVK